MSVKRKTYSVYFKAKLVLEGEKTINESVIVVSKDANKSVKDDGVKSILSFVYFSAKSWKNIQDDL